MPDDGDTVTDVEDPHAAPERGPRPQGKRPAANPDDTVAE